MKLSGQQQNVMCPSLLPDTDSHPLLSVLRNYHAHLQLEIAFYILNSKHKISTFSTGITAKAGGQGGTGGWKNVLNLILWLGY